MNGNFAMFSTLAPFAPSINCYVDVKLTDARVLLFFYDSFLLPDQRETDCYAWHGTRAVTLTWNAPLSKAQCPGISVSGTNRQEFLSPGSVYRRVVPWGTVSSWVKGAE